MSRFLFSTAGVALLSSAALAADIPVYEPPVEVAPVMATYDWTGFYVGAMGGYAFDGESEFDFTTAGTASTTEVDGWFAGGTVGVNWQWNWLVLGVEGDIAWSDIDGSDPCPNPAFQCTVDVDWLGTARGRIGLAWDRLLFFGTGGAAFAGVEADTPPFNPAGELDETYFGWTAGGGVEIGFWQNWSVKGEYAYYDLGEESAAAGILNPTVTEVDLDFHAVKFGINYRF